MKHTTSTGITIGCRYQKPTLPVSADEAIIQSIILGKKSPMFLHEGDVWIWSLVASVLVTILAVVSK